MKPPLLIISDREDFSVDYLIVRLRERYLSYYRLNVDELASSVTTFRTGEDRPQRTLICGEAGVDLDSLKSVWYRRALRPRPPGVVHPQFRAFASAEMRHFYEGLIAEPSLVWVNPLDATELAERKVYQLRIAGRHGLLVPPTLISSDRATLDAFAASYEHVICKSISHGLVRTNDQAFAVHTREVTRAELADSESLGGIPLLLQSRVSKGMDIRVTFIGPAVYPIEVMTPAGAPIDWRAANGTLSYRLCALPYDVERACRSFMQELRLVYGAFDFVRTDDGEWYFLEINPTGEWAWLDVALGLPMRDALIDTLYGF